MDVSAALANTRNVCTMNQNVNKLLDLDFITEAWLNERYFYTEFVPSDYECFRRDRAGISRGAGIIIIFRNILHCIQVKVDNLIQDNVDDEFLVCEL